MKLIAMALVVAAPPGAGDAEAFIRKILTPCELATPMAAAAAVYEPSLAAAAKRVQELAPPSLPEFFDEDIRRCGVLPLRPVSSVKVTKTAGDKLTVIADTGTAASNNRQQTTFLLIQTNDGPRIFDASTKTRPSLRAAIEKRLKELLVVESERQAAVDFMRQALANPSANIYAPSLTALGEPSLLAPRPVASVKAGLNQNKRTAVTVTFTDNAVLRGIVEQTAKGSLIWDLYQDESSLRVALADESERRETLALSDEEAVAFVQRLFASYVNPKLKSSQTPLGAGLTQLLHIDGQLTEGVPYVNGDIVCDCQDFDKFSVESVKAAGHYGHMIRVEASFHVFQDPSYARHAIYVIVKTKQGPRIYDVIEDKGGSLRGRLQVAVAEGYSI